MKLRFRQSAAAGRAEFHRRHPDNLLLVQGTRTGEVLICAMADNLTPEQQEVFIQYLWAEGFMAAGSEPPDCFSGYQPHPEEHPSRWIVDASWPDADPAYAWHRRRLCLCTLGAVLVWLALIILLACG